MVGSCKETKFLHILHHYTMSQFDDRAKPLATPELTVRLLQLIETASNQKQVKRGANEVIKALNRFVIFVLL